MCSPLLCKSNLLVFRCLNMTCWSQKDSFGGTNEHRLASKLEHVHQESCERFIWPRAGYCPSEPGWPLPWISETFTAKAQPHVTASTSTHLFFPPLCNFLDCIRGNDGLGRAKELQEEPSQCPGRIAATALPPRLQLSSFPLWAPTPRPRASALWDSTWGLPSSNIPNFGENGMGLRLFPSWQTVIWFWLILVWFSSQFRRQRNNFSQEKTCLLSHDPWKQEVPCTDCLIFLFI